MNNTGCTLKAQTKKPADVTLYQTDGNSITGQNNAFIIAKVVAPGCTLMVNNNFQLMGSCVFVSITTASRPAFYYDADLAPGGGSGTGTGGNQIATVR